MKNKNCEPDISMLTETNKVLESILSTPELIDTASKQQQIVNTATALATSLEDTFSLLPSKIDMIDNCVSAVTSFRYAIDTLGFNPELDIPCWQNNIVSVATSLSSYMPNIIEAVDFPQMNAIECGIAQILKNAEISVEMTMPSIQIAETLQSFGNICADILPKVDKLLASSQLLFNYSSLIEKQYINIQRNVDNCDKYLKIIDLATAVVQDQIISTATYVADEIIDGGDYLDEDDCFQEENENKPKTIIQYVPIYLGYTFQENTSYDLEEEYFKSALGKIAEGGRNIVAKIQHINDLKMMVDKDAMFKPTNKTYNAVSCLTTSFAADQNTFGSVIDSLYMLIYEASGSAKRICEVLTNEECDILWKIKHLRTDFRHDIEHGTEKDIKSKKLKIGDAYQTICGSIRPFKQKEWVNAHQNVFIKVNDFLDLIIEKLSVSKEGEI